MSGGEDGAADLRGDVDSVEQREERWDAALGGDCILDLSILEAQAGDAFGRGHLCTSTTSF